MPRTCHSCGSENPPDAKFCMGCGTSLGPSFCPSCGAQAIPGARFCTGCGTALADAAPAAAPAPAQGRVLDTGPASPPEERRQVTVLFADLAGFTKISSTLDPETVKRISDRTLMRLTEEVNRFGGTVDKYIGDNVMAIFGAPVAHEDDAQRAVRAGLGMQAAMEEINSELSQSQGAEFALRVGINTGEVIAGAVGDRYTVVGDAVNVASRLESAGSPGDVIVGERTYRATRDAVEYEELVPLELKGKSEPVPAWRARRLLADAPARRAGRIETPLVGRDEQLQLVEDLQLRTVREQRAYLLTLVGQAGVGKSRLLREADDRLGTLDDPPALLQGRCLPYGSGVVYWALGEVLRAECGIVEDDPGEVAWSKLHARLDDLLAEATGEPEEVRVRRTGLVGRLLGMEVPGDAPAVDEDPQRARDSFFSAVRSCVEAMAARRPLVLAFEDIHWADTGMLDLIEHLARYVRAPLLIVCLARDELLERRERWGVGRRTESLVFLEPLSTEQTRELVSRLLPDGSDELATALAERTGGNPLFAEEMVRRVVEEGAEEATELPDTVQAVLAARLDSLAPVERRLVQHASVIGRTFWQEALEPIATAEGYDLRSTLATLEEKDILVAEPSGGRAGDPELAFRHVLIRDVAYGMLPKAVRARKHFEVGAFLEERAGDRSDEVVALLAEHYGRASTLAREASFATTERQTIDLKALRFLEAAGDAASAFYSNREALSHYQSARSLDGGVDPDARARIGEKQGDVALRLGRVDAAIEVWRECLEYHRGQEALEHVAGLLRKIGVAVAHKGERAQAIEHLQKGINLLKDGAPNLELVRLYEEAAWLYLNTGDNMLAIYAAEKALRLAERLEETRAASRAHGIFGRVFGRIGDTAKARENLERSVELARGSDKGETIIALLALGHQLEGSEADYAGAEEAYAEALALAEQVGDVPAQVEAHAGLAQLAVYRADWEALERYGGASASLSEREGLVGRLSLPLVLRGIARWRAGDWDEAEELYRRAHELATESGWSEIAFSALFGLAIARRDREDFGGSVTALDQALDVCERAGLLGRSILTLSTRAVVLAMAGRDEPARESAREATELAERLSDPVGCAAALEADGATAGPDDAPPRLAAAAAAWLDLGRPLDAARCDMLAGRILAPHDPARAAELFERSAEEFERLGVEHLAGRSRELARG